MNEHAAQDVLLIRAIETADGGTSLIASADRERAEREAAAAAGEPGTRAGAEKFLTIRAAALLQTVAARSPKSLKAIAALRGAGWLGVLIPALAFVLGFVPQFFIGPHLDILAFPMLGVIVWNLAVFLWLCMHAVGMTFGLASAHPGRFRAWLVNVSTRLAERVRGPLSEALVAFAGDWAKHAAPLMAARAARLVHVSAALLALGILAGLYLRSLNVAFLASWESTRLTAGDLVSVLHALLAPILALTGWELPTIAQMEELNRQTGGKQQIARIWLDLWSVAVVLYVVLPRLLLAWIARLREKHLAALFPLALDEPYFRTVLASWGTSIGIGLLEQGAAGESLLRQRLLDRRTADNSAALQILLRSDRRDLLQLQRISSERVLTLTREADRSAARGWLDRLTSSFTAATPRLPSTADRLLETVDVILVVVEVDADASSEPTLPAVFGNLDAVGLPVLALLHDERDTHDGSQVDAWRPVLLRSPTVREVLSFDDFARCEFQMEVLLRSVGRCLPAENRSGLERLINVARRQARDRLAASMKLLANHVAAIARDRQVVASDDKSLTQRIQGSLRGSQDDPRRSEAIADLAARTNAAITQATDELLALYGQSKSSSTWLAPPTSNEHQLVVPTNRVKAAALGGVVSGAMSGLMADLATGGLTLGAGMVVGAVVGALGGSGVAQTRDSMRGIDRATVAWGSEFMDRVVRDALLRYLTVLHMGRGKDEELQEQDRQKWTDCIERSFEHDARQYQALWKRAGKLAEDALLVSEIAGLMQSTATHTIAALYPEIADGLYFGDTRRPPA